MGGMCHRSNENLAKIMLARRTPGISEKVETNRAFGLQYKFLHGCLYLLSGPAIHGKRHLQGTSLKQVHSERTGSSAELLVASRQNQIDVSERRASFGERLLASSYVTTHTRVCRSIDMPAYRDTYSDTHALYAHRIQTQCACGRL